MTRTGLFFAGSALVIVGLLVWIVHTTHPKQIAAEAANPATTNQERPVPATQLLIGDAVDTADGESGSANAPQLEAGADSPAAAGTTMAPAITGNLFQCMDEIAGQVTIRKMPCPDNMKTIKVIPYTVQPGSGTVVHISQPLQAPSPAQDFQNRPPSAGEIARARCANAKKYAESERQRLGLKVTLDQLRSIGDVVYDACKSP